MRRPSPGPYIYTIYFYYRGQIDSAREFGSYIRCQRYLEQVRKFKQDEKSWTKGHWMAKIKHSVNGLEF